jgi:nucleoside-diphosphate-sugar epimerase
VPAGFLGSHLCDRFIKEGHHVIAMDNLITGDIKNIEHHFSNKILSLLNMMLQSILKYRQA